MTASVSLLRPEVLEPAELEALGRAYDTIAGVIPKEMQSQALMEAVARRILRRAAAGKVNTAELFLESLCWIRCEERIAI
jgi:hypothetical protein